MHGFSIRTIEMQSQLNPTKIYSQYAWLISMALVSLCCYTTSGAATAARSGMEYRITVDKGLRRLDVNLCFDGDNFPNTLEATEDLVRNMGSITDIDAAM